MSVNNLVPVSTKHDSIGLRYLAHIMNPHFLLESAISKIKKKFWMLLVI